MPLTRIERKVYKGVVKDISNYRDVLNPERVLRFTISSRIYQAIGGMTELEARNTLHDELFNRVMSKVRDIHILTAPADTLDPTANTIEYGE